MKKKLLAFANAGPLKRMFSAAKAQSVLDLYIYDAIGEDWYGDGISPTTVQQAIKDAGTIESIVVHINSPGGYAFDGTAIHNILRQQNVPVTVIVEGLAASAAFTVAMAGDAIQACDGAMMMLHNAWSFAIGDAKEMRKQADLLDKLSGTMCDLYAKRSGLSSEEVQLMMDNETWLNPQDCVDKGFATAILSTTPEKQEAAKGLAAKFDLSKFCSKLPETLKASVTIEKSSSTDPDGDGDDDSVIVDALNKAAELCQPFVGELQTAAADLDEGALKSVVADGNILIPTIQAAIAAAEKELGDDQASEAEPEGDEEMASTTSLSELQMWQERFEVAST
jgi:ATP-dependent Clp protease, protease subunit